MMDTGKALLLGLVVFFVTLLLIGALFEVLASRYEIACQLAGYDDASTGEGVYYCVKRVPVETAIAPLGTVTP